MPVALKRFRVINGSGRTVQHATFNRANVAAVTTNVFDEVDITNVATNTIDEEETSAVGYYLEGAKGIEISIQADSGGDKRKLESWFVFYPDDPEYPAANFISEVQLAVLPVPGGGANDLYARATLYFEDGATWDFSSPYLPEAP